MIRILLPFIFFYQTSAYGFTLIRPGIAGYSDQPLRVHLNVGCPDGVSSELDKAIDFWNAAPQSRLILERSYDVNYAVGTIVGFAFPETIVVYCSANFAADVGADANSILGVADAQDIDNDGILDRGVFVINTTAGSPASFQLSIGTVRELTMTHEFGHVLGLGHSSSSSAIMYFSTGNKTAVNLHQDDIDGIRHLYPQNELDGDYFLGCATVRNISGRGSGPKGPSLVLVILLLIPLALVGFLRFQKKQVISYI